MAIFDRLFGDRTKGVHPALTEKKAASKPIFNRVGPGQAVATPRRYDKLAREGYQQNVIAYRAINLVAKAAASIPLAAYKGDRRLEKHPILDLIARPNPRLKGENFLYNLVGYYLIAGNAYAFAAGPGKGAPKELWLLRPDTMSVVEGSDGLPGAYEQSVAGKKQRYASESILHWKSFNPLSDWYGLAPLEAAAMAVDGHNDGTRWNLALIQNGGAPSGVLYQEGSDHPLTDTQYRSLKEQVETSYTGSMNAGRPLLLEGGLKWQEMGMSPKDMDWASAKNMNAREIALAFGVPPQMLGIPDAQTYSNYAEARLSLWEETIIPLMQDITAELSHWLAPKYTGAAALPDRRGESELRLALDLDDIPALEAKRTARFERIGNASFLSDEEKRNILGYASVDP
jgi:HK97 family phage portal protein